MSLGARRSAFTLLELMLAAIVMAVIASVVMPVIVAATDAYASARSLRTSVESASYAIERIARMIREAPLSESGELLAIAQATEHHLEFADGRGFRFDGSVLELLTAGATAPLARDVEGFGLHYLADDGVTPAAEPAAAHRVHVEMTVGGVRVSVCVFPRVRAGGAP